MRNRWGVEVKKGHWVSGRTSRGDAVQGRVAKIERTGDYARAYGPRVILDNGMSLWVDDISQTLGPMEILDDGTVRQNPGQKLPRGRDRWYVYGSDGALIAGDLFYKTALGALKKVFPGVHVYSSGVSGAGTVSYAIDMEPRHVFVSPDPDFDLRRGARSNPLTRVRIKSPPQRPAGNSSPPSKRLMARRKKTAKAPAGVYANPVVKPIRNRKAALTHGAPDTMRTWNDHYIVQRSPDPDAKAWDSIGVFPKRVDAENFARNYARQHSTQYVRVVTPD